jgi:GDPmannose 4,6-dehydratase
MKKKIALITGITGQDGSYLAEFLIKKNYIVHGVKRKSSSLNTERLNHIYVDPHRPTNLFLHYGDLTDFMSIDNLINKIKPDEIYNLAAQSHVGVSFENPMYTSQVNALGTLSILESIKKSGKKIKFYQASTSELFGSEQKKAYNENSNFCPKSPYGASKLYAHWITKIYRDSYNIFACSGLLFNHESPRRGDTFVTKKITNFFANKINNKREILYLGNIYAKRDWGHSKDYVKMQWRMLQNKKPKDYVIATGKTTSVKNFINECCKYLKLNIIWEGKKLNEKCWLINKKNNTKRVIIKIDKKYYRPLDINYLLGNPNKAKKELKFKPIYNIKKLVKDMLDSEIKNSLNEKK